MALDEFHGGYLALDFAEIDPFSMNASEKEPFDMSLLC